MTERRCGTCRWWEHQGTDDHDPAHIGAGWQSSRDYGFCCWNVTHPRKLPASYRQWEPMYSFDGQQCEVWRD